MHHTCSSAPTRPEQRAAALFELRARIPEASSSTAREEVFQRLVDGKQAGEARRFLLEIYQQEKDWDKAAAMARQLEKETGESRAREMSHFLCEQAATEATHSRPDTARRHLEAALEANRKSVRASLQLGDLERGYGSADRAIEHWKRIEAQNPAFLALVAQRLLEAHREVGRLEEGLTLLTGYSRAIPRSTSYAVSSRRGNRKAPRPPTDGARECGAILRCSASTAC